MASVETGLVCQSQWPPEVHGGPEDVQGRSDVRASRPRGALEETEGLHGRDVPDWKEGRQQARKFPNPDTER